MMIASRVKPMCPPPVEDEELLLDEELLDELLEELLELDDELDELVDDELEEDELEEELVPEGMEHSFTPPVTRPPKVASVQGKVPLSSL